MTRVAVGIGAFVLALVAVAAGFRLFNRIERDTSSRSITSVTRSVTSTDPTSGSAAVAEPAAPGTTTTAPAPPNPLPAVATQGFIYGRITTTGSTVYEGRLRWGDEGTEEAFWGDFFNGYKPENPWVADVPKERLPKTGRPFTFFGLKLADRDTDFDGSRPFMARFGDLARIEATTFEVLVTLKSGTVFKLNRNDASDLDDGVRVWDDRNGVVDVGARRIRTIEFLPTAPLAEVPSRLYGTVRTTKGEFAGFLQWNRQQCVGPDEIHGYTGRTRVRQRFDTIRSIACPSQDHCVLTLLDGREIVASGTMEIGDGNRRGLYVDDPRYGRVLVSSGAFERVDFSPEVSGPAYGDYPPGSPLTGSVTTRDGRRLTGRLVYDLDESETTETLDAPSQGVDYTIPFGLVTSIVSAGGGSRAQLVSVTLRDGETLQLERSGDLGEKNGGLLIFADGSQTPEYVTWHEVSQIDFNGPPAKN